MACILRMINSKGDIEIAICKNEYNETEDICIYKEKYNVFKLLKENQELKKQLDYLRKENLKEEVKE